jgi:protein O-mannosyl-transferase
MRTFAGSLCRQCASLGRPGLLRHKPQDHGAQGSASLPVIAHRRSRLPRVTKSLLNQADHRDNSAVTAGNHRDLWFGILLAVILLLAYRPAWHGTPIFDDAMRIPKPADRSLAGLIHVWIQPSASHQYHPLVDTVFWAETRIFNQRMPGYHLVNILLHALAALLLLKILRHLAIPGAWLATALFALHPLQVESVAYLAEMKNTLSGLFLFAALLVYLHYDRHGTRKSYWLTWFFFLAGLFAKTSTAYLPVVVLLIQWWRRGKLEWRRDVKPLVPFFVVGIMAAIATVWFEARMSTPTDRVVIVPIDRFLIAGRAFWFYLAKIFWPTHLKMFYPRWEIDPGDWWQYLFPAGALVLLLGAWRLRRRWRGPWAGLLFFLLTLIPFLGFFNVRMFRFQFVAEHFEYLPIIGIVVPLSAGIALKMKFWHGWRRSALAGVIAVVLVALTIQTWRHSEAFRNAEICYRDSIANGGENWTVQDNLALILIGRGQFNEAELHLKKALELNPPNLSAVGALHMNLGQVFRQTGQTDEAIEEFRRAVRVWPDFRAYDSLASALHQRGKTREAIANYTRAMELEPRSAVAPANLAWILASTTDDSLRNGSRALQLALKAEKLSGDIDPFSLHALAAAYAETGNYSKAIETARRAVAFATKNQLSDLAAQLRSEITLYETNLPVRERLPR